LTQAGIPTSLDVLGARQAFEQLGTSVPDAVRPDVQQIATVGSERVAATPSAVPYTKLGVGSRRA
jgi:hypothetical protein